MVSCGWGCVGRSVTGDTVDLSYGTVDGGAWGWCKGGVSINLPHLRSNTMWCAGR